VLPEHLIAMLETLPRGTLHGLLDRAMLLLGFAGGLRRRIRTRYDRCAHAFLPAIAFAATFIFWINES
jgi:hypothetical protein